MKTDNESQKNLQQKTSTSLDLISATAHDMKTPLVLISGLSDRLLADSLSREQQREYLERIRVSSERLLGLVDTLSSAGLSSRRHSELDTTVNVNLVAEEVIDEQRAHATHRHIQLRFTAAKSPLAKTHRPHLKQIVDSMLDTAIRSSRPNSTVDVRLLQRGSRLTLTVRDHGPGMRKEDMERVFHMFGQLLEPTNAQPDSSGVQLFIARQLADRLGGSLHVTTQKRGSTVSLSLAALVQPTLFDEADI